MEFSWFSIAILGGMYTILYSFKAKLSSLHVLGPALDVQGICCSAKVEL